MLLSEFILSFLEGKQANLYALRRAAAQNFYWRRRAREENVYSRFLPSRGSQYRSNTARSLPRVCTSEASSTITLWSLPHKGPLYFDSGEEIKSRNAKKVFNSTISRLKKQGFLECRSSGTMKILKRGHAHLLKLRGRRPLPKHHPRKSNSGTVRDTVIIFDVPERLKNNRGWLRIELVALGFEMLQKSAWIGTGPLPKKFLEDLRELHIFECVHIFSIRKGGTIIE